jgi:hypothetical protein
VHPGAHVLGHSGAMRLGTREHMNQPATEFTNGSLQCTRACAAVMHVVMCVRDIHNVYPAQT